MGMFDFLKKKGSRIEATTLVKRMSDGVLDYEGLPLDDRGYPKAVYLYGEGLDTMASQAQKTRRLKRCVYTVKQLCGNVRKHGMVAFYLKPGHFKLSFRTADGNVVSCVAEFKTGDRFIGYGQSAEFGNWLDLNIKTPSENIDAEALGRLLDGCYPSDRLPDWLVIDGEPEVSEPQVPVVPESEPAPEPATEEPEASVETLTVGARIFDRYLIERELGKGGMGKVFLAKDQLTMIETRKRVVLKVLHLENAHDADSQEQFKKEANTLANLRNDRIAACYGSLMLGDVPILIMEYVEGVSLDEFLAEREGALDERTTRELLLPIAEALDYAHRKNIYHLDVKPQNIIVRKTPQMGIKTCLLDFGIARKAHPDGTMTYRMAAAGTPPYMSQEQRNNELATAAMDVFALAVTAYECLTGEMPYPHGQTINHQVNPLPSNGAFPQAIMRGLDINPRHRPASCVDLINPPPAPAPAPTTPVTPTPVPARPAPSAPVQPKPMTPEVGSLNELKKSFENYRMMLAQSATRCARTHAERADWMRDLQAQLRDLTTDLARAREDALLGLFHDIRTKIEEERLTPEAFFVATDRLVELRAGLPQTGGKVWRALKDSVCC